MSIQSSPFADVGSIVTFHVNSHRKSTYLCWIPGNNPCVSLLIKSQREIRGLLLVTRFEGLIEG